MIVYRLYLLPKPLIVNEHSFNEIVISSHYEENHISYMNDKKILEIVQQLDKRNYFVPHRQGKLPDGTEWQSFFMRAIFSRKQSLSISLILKKGYS